jgi:glycosyltransferase involved in cell wall biosynthesis
VKITLCAVHLDRLHELEKWLPYHASYVDRIIISDGGSRDGSLEWLQGEAQEKYGVETIVKKQYRMPYGDHTPEARNPYLLQAGVDGWILVLDTDEYIEEEALPKLHAIAEKAEELGYDEARFQARDVWTYETGEVDDNLAETYWKEHMFFKACQGMTYVGHTHSGVYRPGSTGSWVKTGFHYRHEKSEKQMWKNSSFLYWTTCQPASNRTDDPTWLQFHEMVEKYGYQDWHEFNRYMEAGNIAQEIKDWFLVHKDHENPEICSYFLYYFLWLHPEENINKVSSEKYDRYTWDYLARAKIKKNET